MHPAFIKRAFEDTISQGGPVAGGRNAEGVPAKVDIIGRTFANPPEEGASLLRSSKIGKLMEFSTEVVPGVVDSAKRMGERLRQLGANNDMELAKRPASLEKKSNLDPAQLTQGAIAGAANQYFQNREENRKWLGLKGIMPLVRKDPFEGVANAALGGAIAQSGVPEMLQQPQEMQ